MRKIMHTLILGLLLLGAPLSLTACQTPPPEVISNVQQTSTKALYVAEAGFKGVSVALEAAVDSGQLKGDNAAKALKIYDDLKATLDKARTTKQLSDAVLAQQYVADLWDLLSSFAA